MTKKQNVSEKFDAIDDELLEAIARVKGHAVQKAEPCPVSEIFPVSNAAKKAAIVAWLKAEKKALENPASGQCMPDGSIYVGNYSPKNHNGYSLGQVFKVFAAKEDLPGGPRTYNETVAYLATLKDWNGYDGAGYQNDKELYWAIKYTGYDGKWIIPTRDILDGQDANDRLTTPDNLFEHRDKGGLKGTFNSKSGGKDYPGCYWSCTQDRGLLDPRAFSVNFPIGACDLEFLDLFRQSCRPVRLVPCQ